jgi:hypothetical protein
MTTPDPTSPSGWTRLIELFNASDKVGFGFLVAGGVSLYGADHDVAPFTLMKSLPALHFFIIFFTLFGGATCTPGFIRILKTLWGRLSLKVRRWWWRRTTMDRAIHLIPFERLSLAWIAHHRDSNVFGSRFEDPFRSLLREGFIVAAHKTGHAQGFQINPVVYRRANRKNLRQLCPKGADQHIDNEEPPWKRLVGRLRY